MENKPICYLCGGAMKKSSVNKRGTAGTVTAFLCLASGIGLCFTGVGLVFGIVLILVSGEFLRTKKVIRCRNCGHYVERA